MAAVPHRRGVVIEANSLEKPLVTREGAIAARLPNGDVLIAGGEDPIGAAPNVLNTAERFDPATDTFSPVPGTMTVPRAGAIA